MTATWVIGDIHGCAEELADLIEQLDLQHGDRLISVGDLYHRGPDPHGVVDLLTAQPGFELVLGNHERVLLQRAGVAGDRSDGQDCAELPAEWQPGERDLLGDGGTAIHNLRAGAGRELVTPLVGRPYYLRGGSEEQPWVITHAGLVPGRKLDETPPELLCSLRRLQHVRGQPYWYEAYSGPRLVVFGHTPARFPRRQSSGGRLVALGMDTGCVYGGALSAVRMEDLEMAVVPARRSYV